MDLEIAHSVSTWDMPKRPESLSVEEWLDGCKYIRAHGRRSKVWVFPRSLAHADMARRKSTLERVLSAGFIRLKNGVLQVDGESTSISDICERPCVALAEDQRWIDALVQKLKS